MKNGSILGHAGLKSTRKPLGEVQKEKKNSLIDFVRLKYILVEN